MLSQLLLGRSRISTSHQSRKPPVAFQARLPEHRGDLGTVTLSLALLDVPLSPSLCAAFRNLSLHSKTSLRTEPQKPGKAGTRAQLGQPQGHCPCTMGHPRVGPGRGVPGGRGDVPAVPRMSVRSPVSPPPELDGAGAMVNCAVKTEEKKESPETPPGAAPSAEPRPQDPPGPPPRDGTDPQALPQVGVTKVGLSPPLLQTFPSRGRGAGCSPAWFVLIPRDPN